MDWQEWQDTKKQIYEFIIENRSMYRDDGVDVGLGDIIDFLNATVTKTGRKITVDAHGWGGWPLYDYYVDDNWADTGLAEGTILNTYTGTKIYSTIQGAIDHAETRANESLSIFVCPGTYAENLDVNLASGARLEIVGAQWEYGSVRVCPTSGVALTITNEQEGLTLRHIMLHGPLGGSALVGAISNIEAYFDRCQFLRAVNADFAGAQFRGCVFGLSTAVAAYGTDATMSPATVQFTDCIFNDGFTIAADISNHLFNNCMFLGGLVFTTTCIFDNVGFVGCQFGTGGAPGTWLTFNVYSLADLRITGCRFEAAGGNKSTIYFQASQGTSGIAITGNTFEFNGTTTAIAYIHSDDANLEGVAITGNSFGKDGDGNYREDLGAYYSISGLFKHSAIGPNAPARALYDVDGANNIFNPPSSWVGSPSGETAIILYDNGVLSLGFNKFLCRFDNVPISVAAGTITLTNTATNYVEVNSAGTVSSNTTGYTLASIPLGKVVCAGGDITSITEESAKLDETRLVKVSANDTTPNFLLAKLAAGTGITLTETNDAGDEDVTIAALTAGGSAAAPNDAQYLVLTADDDLTVERVFAPGAGLTATDDGAGGNYHLIHATDASAIPSAHHIRYKDTEAVAAAKTVKLDDLTAPDANTDLNASTTAHGLMIAAVDPASAVQRHVACTDNAETAWKAADLFDATHPEALGTATEGTSLLAAHRDHVHAGVVTALTGTASRFIYVAADGTVDEVELGADGTVLTSTGAGTAPGFEAPAGGGGAMATDPLWDAAGDLAVGTGADTGAKLALTVPGAANLMNVLGVVNGETTPVWKVLFDATAPEAIGTAAAGTGVVAAHRNHVHAIAGANVHMITGSFYTNPESTTIPKLILGPMPFAGTFVKLTIKSYDVAAESAIRVDLHKQTAANENTNTSTTVFTTQTNRPTIAATSYAGNTTTFEVSTFAKGDWLYFFLDVDDSGITVLDFGLEVTPT